MFGKPWEGRGALMDECLSALLRAWSGEPFDYQGRAVRMTPRPLTQPLPPVAVGGSGRYGARRAARFGLPFAPAVNSPEVFALYESECECRGVVNPEVRPPGTGEMVWVSEDPDRSWSEMGPHLLHEATSYAAWQREGQRSEVRSHADTVEALRVEGKYLVLTPAQCIERAREQGPRSAFVLYPLCGGLPPDLAWPSLELYANKVLPNIR